jgi:membrane protease YdiL (CAAX protease family)
MDQNPLLLLLLTATSVYLAKLLRDDTRTAAAGQPNPRALPGATRAPTAAYVIAIAGALALLAFETVGEHALGLSAQQSQITVLFGVYTLAAAVIEEVVFRGYIVVDRAGRTALWTSVVAASLLFAALHPFLWRWDAAGFTWTLNAKGAFSTAVVFATSLWLYAARFAGWNPARSIWPCIAAHAAKNAGVFVIKAAGGFVAGLW